MRFYFHKPTGQFVPSGTSILPKPYLAQWAANVAVDYMWECSDLPIMTEEMCNKARKAFLRESTEAADYGTYIHTMCQYSLENNLELESPHEMTDKFMKGLWKWKTKHKVKVIAMEHEVVTDTYGGRLDLVCEMDKVVTLVDFKTGKSSYYDTWKWQLAGYRQAWNEHVESDIECMGMEDMATNYREGREIQTHGILKFSKQTQKVNYKSFDSYSATRTNPETKEKEKYTRTYETDRATFNSLVKLWWLRERGIEI